MKFTYDDYAGLLKRLGSCGYEFAGYKDWQDKTRPVILRHDIDADISKAVEMAARERDAGAASTYFVLLTSGLYNAFSKESYNGLRKIMDMEHTVGLHFDEARYPECEGDHKTLIKHICEEADILSNIIGSKVETVSMHRPSRGLLEADISIPGMINSYSKLFFSEFKYLSDSRRRWREPVEEIIDSGEYDRLHILTHAFWYDEEDTGISATITDFVNSANRRRYEILGDNISDLGSLMKPEEIR